MPAVPSSRFIRRQTSLPLIPGSRTSSTMTSGRWRTTASSAASAGADVVHLDVDDLEGRPQERRNAASSSTMSRRTGGSS